MSAGQLRLVIGSPYPWDPERVGGGVESSALYLTRALARRPDVEVHVVSFTRHVRREVTEDRDGLIVHWLPFPRRGFRLRALSIDLVRTRRLYRRLQPDIVHSQHHAVYALAVPRDLPSVVTLHSMEMFAPSMRGVFPYDGPRGDLVRLYDQWLVRIAVRRARAVVSVAGAYLSDMLRRHARTTAPVYEIFNPIDARFWGVTDRRDDGSIVILCPGAIIPRKNQMLLVAAFAEAARDDPRVELHLAGGTSDPIYRDRVLELADECGVRDRVHLPGSLSEPAMRAAYGRADIIALASRQETAPMAVAQAAAAGRPSVATRVGGTESVLRHDITGLLVDVDDEAGLAGALRDLASNPSRRAAMGRAGRAFADRHFRPTVVAAGTIQAYRSLVEHRSVV